MSDNRSEPASDGLRPDLAGLRSATEGQSGTPWLEESVEGQFRGRAHSRPVNQRVESFSEKLSNPLVNIPRERESSRSVRLGLREGFEPETFQSVRSTIQSPKTLGFPGFREGRQRILARDSLLRSSKSVRLGELSLRLRNYPTRRLTEHPERASAGAPPFLPGFPRVFAFLARTKKSRVRKRSLGVRAEPWGVALAPQTSPSKTLGDSPQRPTRQLTGLARVNRAILLAPQADSGERGKRSGRLVGPELLVHDGPNPQEG